MIMIACLIVLCLRSRNDLEGQTKKVIIILKAATDILIVGAHR